MKLQKELQKEITTIQAFDTKTGEQIIDGIIWDGSMEHLAKYITKAYKALNHSRKCNYNDTLKWLYNNFNYYEDFALNDIKYIFGEYFANKYIYDDID